MSADGVPLFEGTNSLMVWAWNGDGRCREPGTVAGLMYRKPLPPKPVVEFLDPARDAQVEQAERTVRYRVHSTSPLRRVELVREAWPASGRCCKPLTVGDLVKNARNGFEVSEGTGRGARTRARITFGWSPSIEGGEAVASLVISYVPPPVRVVIDRVKPKSGRDPAIQPTVMSDNRFAFPEPIPEGQAWLEGRVVWPDEASQSVAEVPQVLIWVNGFPQGPVALRKDLKQPRERTFRAPIVLNGKENRVEIDVPDLPQVSEARPTFDLACLQPDTRQRLHLLIIGVGATSESRLRDSVIQALHGQLVEGSSSRFKTPAFLDGVIYGPLCGDVREHRVYGELYRIRNAIRLRHPAPDAPNEVVLIYYQGGEWITNDRATHLRLRKGQGTSAFDTIPIKSLVAIFRDTPAAKVFLLDVTRPADAQPVPLDPHVGLLRTAWLRPTGDTAEPAGDTWLISSLEEATSRFRTLDAVASAIESSYGMVKDSHPDLRLDTMLPLSLSQLIIGQPAGPGEPAKAPESLHQAPVPRR